MKAYLATQSNTDASLEDDATCSSSKDRPGPLVLELLQARPETVFLALVLLELLVLERVLLGIALLLTGLVLLVTTDESEEDVVGNRSKDRNRVKDAGTVEKNGERDVD